MRNRFRQHLQKLTALILVAVLAFVYAEQTFHRHEYKIAAHAEQGIAVTYDYSTCALCDFQLAAVADLPKGPECTVPTTLVQHTFALLPVPIPTSSLFQVKGRGPPMV